MQMVTVVPLGGCWGIWTGVSSLLLTFPRILPVSGSLLVTCSLPEPLSHKVTCLKVTHANGYCGAWPGWVVSVSVSPNRGREQRDPQLMSTLKKWRVSGQKSRLTPRTHMQVECSYRDKSSGSSFEIPLIYPNT